ncbi:uncharacterized protein LOC112344790 [Selaginella moellendorffii]|uniref:uncharacterized protein LOC112344790 n=1 Tax=Selaginella moellendorffii TaxID=88036 RepID=UPI000D1CF30B|nr:uncharacterized protein LOC112344790 [Selaginella moellendorffii]|eukprot:XP_024525888.1 uncharacterized protein LOC112344790 [Selaginella moellendorffii]
MHLSGSAVRVDKDAIGEGIAGTGMRCHVVEKAAGLPQHAQPTGTVDEGVAHVDVGLKTCAEHLLEDGERVSCSAHLAQEDDECVEGNGVWLAAALLLEPPKHVERPVPVTGLAVASNQGVVGDNVGGAVARLPHVGEQCHGLLHPSHLAQPVHGGGEGHRVRLAEVSPPHVIQHAHGCVQVARPAKRLDAFRARHLRQANTLLPQLRQQLRQQLRPAQLANLLDHGGGRVRVNRHARLEQVVVGGQGHVEALLLENHFDQAVVGKCVELEAQGSQPDESFHATLHATAAEHHLAQAAKRVLGEGDVLSLHLVDEAERERELLVPAQQLQHEVVDGARVPEGGARARPLEEGVSGLDVGAELLEHPGNQLCADIVPGAQGLHVASHLMLLLDESAYFLGATRQGLGAVALLRHHHQRRGSHRALAAPAAAGRPPLPADHWQAMPMPCHHRHWHALVLVLLVSLGAQGMAGSSKPTLVRIKRKRCHEPVDLLWLEHSATKRRGLDADAANLTLLDAPHSSGGQGGGKLLFCRLQTVEASQVKDASLSESLMSELSATRQEARKSGFKRAKTPSASAAARQQHERDAKAARYKQVWKNRLGLESEDVMPQFFHLYDVVRTTGGEETRERDREDNELLMKYMPLLEEFCPENFPPADASTEDFVYDVYVQQAGHEQLDVNEEDDLLTLQVSDSFAFGLEDQVDSDYDSEDSNREDRPECDYPDEEDGDCSEDELEDSDPDDEKISGSSDDEEDTNKYIWKSRR